MNMTGMADILKKVSDTAFTVQFRRQPAVEDVSEQLSAFAFKDFKDYKKLGPLVKQIIEGKTRTMTCHLV
jgi:hypothetical protein